MDLTALSQPWNSVSPSCDNQSHCAASTGSCFRLAAGNCQTSSIAVVTEIFFQCWWFSWRESSRGSWDDCYKSCEVNHNSHFNREEKKYLCTMGCGPFCPPGVKEVFLLVSLRVRLASGGLVVQYAKSFCQNPGEPFCLLHIISMKGFRRFAGVGAKEFAAWRLKLLVRGKNHNSSCKPTALFAAKVVAHGNGIFVLAHLVFQY